MGSWVFWLCGDHHRQQQPSPADVSAWVPGFSCAVLGVQMTLGLWLGWGLVQMTWLGLGIVAGLGVSADDSGIVAG
jgi:hypothetical protein